jgi:hypothetical protein
MLGDLVAGHVFEADGQAKERDPPVHFEGR